MTDQTTLLRLAAECEKHAIVHAIAACKKSVVGNQPAHAQVAWHYAALSDWLRIRAAAR